MSKIVVIVAGGSGTRMGADIPKQFLLLRNEPILMHTIRRFYKYNSELNIRLVLPKEQVEYWNEQCRTYNFEIEHEIFFGGENRFQSVKNGLEGIPLNKLVAIHDGVRPLVSKQTIDSCFKKAEELGAAIPVMTPYESIRKIEEKSSTPVDRSKYVLIQTPQIFKSEILLKAYDCEYSNAFTDDATVVEGIGHKIELVEGNRENIKITSPIDLKIAETLLDF
ncbi:MAG: 2-C-methyl-D-erythritol 4-phosphate cytidylyltransferase [Bacteroidales bacterium]|nr:2-C-methyl-D-erythritol 4-phosphate cytidylyltransferase [Bacteroidales bacterium]